MTANDRRATRSMTQTSTRPPQRYRLDASNGSGLLAVAYHLADNGIHAPSVYKAAASDPDTLTFDQAMADDRRSDWLAAARAEVESLESKGTWLGVDVNETGSRILPGTWVFRHKRTPDGKL